MSATLEAMTCPHGMPNPAACTECMAEGRFLPAAARKARAGQAGVGGYTLDNDCTVQAICAALGAEWADAAAALRGTGWVPGHGATEDQISAAVQALGFELRGTGHTLGSAAATGRTYIVAGFRGRRGHAWVIEAGQHLNGLGWQRAAGMRYRVFEVVA